VKIKQLATKWLYWMTFRCSLRQFSVMNPFAAKENPLQELV
jgi:hypothetical protein